MSWVAGHWVHSDGTPHYFLLPFAPQDQNRPNTLFINIFFPVFIARNVWFYYYETYHNHSDIFLFELFAIFRTATKKVFFPFRN